MSRQHCVGIRPFLTCLVLLAWCCRDDPASRRLTLLWVANNSMSVDLCASVAYSEQYLVFGVQGGSECWAGALLVNRCLQQLAVPLLFDKCGMSPAAGTLQQRLSRALQFNSKPAYGPCSSCC